MNDIKNATLSFLITSDSLYFQMGNLHFQKEKIKKVEIHNMPEFTASNVVRWTFY